MLFIMNKLPDAKRAAIIRALVEGNSVRSTCRITGAAKGTVLKLLGEVGAACLAYQRMAFVNLPCARIQCDEIWSFVGAKEKRATPEQKARGFGDTWTWTAICADTKLIPCWHVGRRDADEAAIFFEDLASRLANRVQLTTDGHKAYLTAVEKAFGWNGIDYAMLVKLYGDGQSREYEKRFSPAECVGAEPTPIMGAPDPAHISTSFAEASNLTMRMRNRRMTRLTNGYSKKMENHIHAVSLFMMAYNFVHVHHTLTKARRGIHTTPAMEAGVTDRVWSVDNLIALLDR
jgi:IS1 family transposase